MTDMSESDLVRAWRPRDVCRRCGTTCHGCTLCGATCLPTIGHQPCPGVTSWTNVGDRVAVVVCTDEYTVLVPGEQGTVTFIDALDTVHVDWDNGSKLGLTYYGGDRWDVVRVGPCPYCGPGRCYGSARTAGGRDLERWLEVHKP